MARYVIIRWFGIGTRSLDAAAVEVVVLKRYRRPLSVDGRAPPVSRLAVPSIVDRGAESSGASVNGTFRAGSTRCASTRKMRGVG